MGISKRRPMNFKERNNFVYFLLNFNGLVFPPNAKVIGVINLPFVVHGLNYNRNLINGSRWFSHGKVYFFANISHSARPILVAHRPFQFTFRRITRSNASEAGSVTRTVPSGVCAKDSFPPPTNAVTSVTFSRSVHVSSFRFASKTCT